jgi:hypothetical protein
MHTSPSIRELSSVICRHDPVGINFGDNPDEYDPEARELATRLPQCKSRVDVEHALRAIIEEWFGETPPAAFDYRILSEEIWKLWLSRGPYGTELSG